MCLNCILSSVRVVNDTDMWSGGNLNSGVSSLWVTALASWQPVNHADTKITA